MKTNFDTEVQVLFIGYSHVTLNKINKRLLYLGFMEIIRQSTVSEGLDSNDIELDIEEIII